MDATFGRGGHSRMILAQLGAGGRLIALDNDLACDPRRQVLKIRASSLFIVRFRSWREVLR